MQLSKLGEFGLIQRIKKSVKTDRAVVQGIGDDCAVIKFDRRRYLLYTADMLVEGVDFRSGENLYLVGRKALAASISDIAACGGIPRFALISLGLAKNSSVESVDQIYRGINYFARKFGVNVAGGDLSSAKQLVIDVSLLGIVEKKNLVLRRGARPGDIIFVSGSLGAASKGKHLKFIPRLKAARYLVQNFKVNAMLDVSDGLTQDLEHILEASRVGAVIYADFIPLSRACRSLGAALSSGEEFELLFTLSPKEAARLALKSKEFSAIGKIMPQKFGLCLIDKKGRRKRLKAQGFVHF